MHSCPGILLRVQNVFGGATSGWTCWAANASPAIQLTALRGDITFDRLVAFGSTSVVIDWATTPSVGIFRFPNFSLQRSGTGAGAGVTPTIGMRFSVDVSDVLIDNAHLGTDISQQFATGIFQLGTSLAAAQQRAVRCILRDAVVSGTVFQFLPNLQPRSSYFRFQRYNQDNFDHRSFYREGLLTYDSAIFYDTAPSLRMTPSGATFKLESNRFRVPVASGATLNITVRVRKSDTGAGDAATYNGNQPRLMLEGNHAAHGNTSNTVMATASNAANGAWEDLVIGSSMAQSDTVFSFYFDCDGSVGWVNIDGFVVA
jgi:hypothetical protein